MTQVVSVRSRTVDPEQVVKVGVRDGFPHEVREVVDFAAVLCPDDTESREGWVGGRDHSPPVPSTPQ